MTGPSYNRRTAMSQQELSSWRERLSALRYLPRFLREIWLVHPGYTLGIVTLRFVRAFIPVVTLWVGKLILDEVVLLTTRGATDDGRLWQYVALEVTILLLGDLASRLSTVLERLLGELVSIHINVRIMRHATELDLQRLEEHSFFDQLARARKHAAGRRLGPLSQLLNTAQDALTVTALGTAILSFEPWMGILLCIAVVPGFLGEARFARLEYSLLYRFTSQQRQLDYLHFLAASERAAKEVQIFGLGDWLTERYRAVANRFYMENRQLTVRKSAILFTLGLLGTAGHYGAIIAILSAAIRGAITIGELTFLVGSFTRSRDLVQRILLSASEIYEQSLYLRDLFGFFDVQPRISSTAGAPPIPRQPRTGFVFEDVGFRYPDNCEWALRNISFELRPGECTALVGENGAGKTTIVKLLARLYDPTEGRITLDGVDLRDYDLMSLRKAMGVVFQDYVRFEMCLDENIGVGDIGASRRYLDAAAVPSACAEPLPAVPECIRTAAERGMASRLLPQFEVGYRQMLGRAFEGGVGLSGGEWQKVAIARGYMRLPNAQLLILDEPTAALDPRAEFETFERFRDIARGRTTVVITHRISTARMADRVLVLSKGRLVEAGGHAELLSRGGLYAELFEMQATPYR